jgi:hypothetical protein
VSVKSPHENSKVEIRRTLQRLNNQYDTNFWTNSLGPTAADQVFISSAANVAAWGAVGTGLIVNSGNLELSHLGIEDLSDPGADRIFFWDDSATASKWLSLDSSLQIVDTVFSVVVSEIDHGGLAGLTDDDHTQYLLADGTRGLTGNLTVDALVTIDGRDLSVDGSKLDGIENLADVTDATNVAAAGAAMSGGAFHDGFSDFVANEHIDWTGATNDFYTTGSGRFDNGIGVGAPPVANRAIYVDHSVTDINNAHGVQVVYENTTTGDGTYNARALTFVCNPNVDATYTNSGHMVGVYCQSLSNGGLAGTLAKQTGILANVGTYTGTTGTIVDAAAGRFALYRRAGTITTGYILHLASDGSGTITNGYAIYDESDALFHWVLKQDNKKIRLGFTPGDFDFYSDGTDATIDATGDIFLNPTGNVKFGTHSAIAAETLSGYITIKDSGGTTRKIGVVS